MAAGPHGNSAQRLVVFGCGYIGTAVATAALSRGLEVTALTRNAAHATTLHATGIRTVVADLAAKNWHTQIPGRPDFVLNCVSSASPGIDGYRQSYLEGMQSIVRWAEATGSPGTCVYTSSTAVYPQEGGVEVTESDAAAEASECATGDRGAVLRSAEATLAQSHRTFGRWFVLRLAGIYGPGRTHLVSQVRSGMVSGTGSHHLNLAHRDDIVAAVLACFNAPSSIRDEIFNVADDSRATKSEITSWLAQHLDIPPPHFTGVPVTGRTPVPDRIISNTKIKQRLGWRPKYPTFREGYEAVFLAQ